MKDKDNRNFMNDKIADMMVIAIILGILACIGIGFLLGGLSCAC